MTDRMDQILEGMIHGDSPIELRMQVAPQSHNEMLAQIKTAAQERLTGDRTYLGLIRIMLSDRS